MNLEHTLEVENAILEYEILPTIIANEPQIVQLFQNIIENGIKYNVCNSEHVSKVFEYEDWYKLKYNQCIWDINPKWKETYQLRQDQ